MNQGRFPFPRQTKDDLTRHADLYRRLAAAMRDRAKADELVRFARKYEEMAAEMD